MAGHHQHFAAKKSAKPRVPVETQSPAGRVLSSPRPAASFQKLTPHGKRVVHHRQRVLAKFEALVQAGCSKSAAARQVGWNRVTIWKWKRYGIIPRNTNSGRRSAVAHVRLTPKAIAELERLIVVIGQDKAWPAFSQSRFCPAHVALRSIKSMPAPVARMIKLIPLRARCRAFISGTSGQVYFRIQTRGAMP